MRVDSAVAMHTQVTLVVRHLALLDGAGAERGARRRPALVSFALEIIEQNVRPFRSGSIRRRGFGGAFEEGELVAPHDAVAPEDVAGFPAALTNDILQPSGQFRLDRLRAGVLHRVTHDRGRQPGVSRVEGDERRERLQRHADRRFGITILDKRDGILEPV